MELTDLLFNHADPAFAEFHSKLIPGVSRASIIGVRIPEIRKIARQYRNTSAAEDFISQLPHKYYDENVLHSVLLSIENDYNNCIYEIDRFLPYIDNWAVCDTLSPKIFRKNRDILTDEISRWVSSDKTYTIRFGIKMIMDNYLDSEFSPEYLKIPADVTSDEYYVNMMVAWFFATALAKQWDSTIQYVEGRILPPWIHNKTIQKACESYRISPVQKEYLKKYKIF